MKRTIISFAAVYGLIVGATSCGGGGNNITVPTSPQTAPYKQIERLARPAIKEATQPFAQHDDTNRTAPWQQPFSSQSLYQAIGSFASTAAGRSPATVTALQTILIPDEIAVDLSQSTTTAAYLGVESGGATGSKFGGRALSDDVIDIDLGAVFGNTLAKLGVVPDDGKESPCLTTDNVGGASVIATKKFSTTFPYVGAPN